ncbi:hypothetical protein BI049_gp152 [Salmonella phage vB_SnwM_CGG4-1]|uniref:Uncharacterized protein n=1 Tax=Salmonella phage vB_SnwM_CGG4-1 TaxID=1815631 RepID=A0A1B0VVP3_9CAUD|nr:hypothetical protein BI049_gp152 [Salmonella phage vB_SnwM_CGG4-1]ANA49581.1 hypothetical protein CGG41_227 [Salmonella phage vB_SnwM_CGG4-1]
MARLELDIVAKVHRNEYGIASDLIFDDESRFYDVDHGLDFDLITENGHGGWPVIYLRGSEKNIRKWLEDNQYEDIDWLLDEFMEQ